MDQAAETSVVKKPRAINTSLIRAQIYQYENKNFIMIHAAGAVTPDAATRLAEWLTNARAWIKLQERKK